MFLFLVCYTIKNKTRKKSIFFKTRGPILMKNLFIFLVSIKASFTCFATEKSRIDSTKVDTLFFDDAALNSRNHELCPNIEFIKVPQSEVRYNRNQAQINWLQYMEETNQRTKIFPEPRYKRTMYDPLSGINLELIEEAKSKIEENHHIKNVVFDWDQTLTVFKGIIVPNNKRVSLKDHAIDNLGITQDEYINYYFGGSKRVSMLRDFFQYLALQNIKIIILSNNLAITKAKQCFSDLLTNLGGLTTPFPKENLHCCKKESFCCSKKRLIVKYTYMRNYLNSLQPKESKTQRFRKFVSLQYQHFMKSLTISS